ncbi:MAG: LLM class flavin-dependent oxidoreductase [Armatimonadota bacterium]|nr:LLM class flavin-dependent oxidoreductase [Armatimonadota bacterium]MDR7534006.1 LLM class flavin-dependent oxidoreductase [Armatimonadota bacterium]MDR7536537.1 LLM class flavin-dependent oxidoreductase [Armatimonadota bacterium]
MGEDRAVDPGPARDRPPRPRRAPRLRGLGVVVRDLLPPAGRHDLLPVEALVDLAALADRLGYESLWVPEGRGRELFSLLGAMARVTRRVRLATGIMPIYSRPPALAAMAAATLADLTGGRFILGLGTGHPGIVEEGYDHAYRQPLVAMREYVEIVRRVLAGGPVAVAGQVFRVHHFEIEAPPRHAVPVYVAALGEQMLRLAGQTADGVILNWMGPGRAAWAVDVARRAAREAGRDPADLTVVCFVRAAVTQTPDAARRVLRRLVATYAAMPAYSQMFAAAGYAGEMAAVEGAWASGGVEAAAATLSAEFVAELSAVGDAAACRARFAAYHAAGVDVVAAYPFPFGADPAASLRATVEGLAAA